jgi:hypothetical protein
MPEATLTKQLMAIACSNSLRFCEVLRFCAATSFLLSAVVFSAMLVFRFLGFALGFQHIAEGSSATDSLSEDVTNVTDVTEITEVSQKVLVI